MFFSIFCPSLLRSCYRTLPISLVTSKKIFVKKSKEKESRFNTTALFTLATPFLTIKIFLV